MQDLPTLRPSVAEDPKAKSSVICFRNASSTIAGQLDGFSWERKGVHRLKDPQARGQIRGESPTAFIELHPVNRSYHRISEQRVDISGWISRQNSRD